MRVKRYLSNLIGWRTNRKLIVFESDDWGSIRMPNKASFRELDRMGLDLVSKDAERYNRFDTLASKEDLEILFETLALVKDSHGKPGVFTPMAITANPDFDKIHANKYEYYFFEPFINTLKKYAHENVFDHWVSGIRDGIFVPQFHGREHLNVPVWMRALKAREAQVMVAFEHGTWGFNNVHPNNVMFQAAYDVDNYNDVIAQEEILISGLALFEKLFGYRASYFVPPNGPFNRSLEQIIQANGIKYISVAKVQKEPLGEGKYKKSFHYLGQRNSFGQYYVTRNCFFEPSKSEADWVDKCLFDIKTAFIWKKPAVISTHRVNYIGVHSVKNRDNSIRSLSTLIKTIVKKWPDVEFITSDSLGDMISNQKTI